MLQAANTITTPIQTQPNPIKNNIFLKIGISLGIGYALYKAFGTQLGLKAPTCTNRVKCQGITKNGKLKKGYKFAKKRKSDKTARVVKV